MWTDPDHRGKGLGRALILKAISWLKEHGVKEVHLSVTLRDSPAMRLYESMGFSSFGEPEPLREGSALLLQSMKLDIF